MSDDSARLATTLRLVDEVAHDLNNALVVIKGYAAVMRRGLKDAQHLADLAEVETAADSAARLTRRLLELGECPQ